MSMVHCDECERLIDSDDDPDCFVDTCEATTVISCNACREVDVWCWKRIDLDS